MKHKQQTRPAVIIAVRSPATPTAYRRAFRA
jgi:hypothetical protein